MWGDAVEVVGPEGAAAAADLPVRTVHEVVDDELAALAEEIREHLPAILALEDVFLLDPLPRQVPALPAELITTTGELLFRGEKTRAGGDPVLVTHDSMFGHGALQWDYGSLASGLRRSAFAPITSCAANVSPLACAARRASADPFFARRFPPKWRGARRTAAGSTCCCGSSSRPTPPRAPASRRTR